MKYERYIVIGLFALILLRPQWLFMAMDTITSPLRFAFLKFAEIVVGIFI